MPTSATLESKVLSLTKNFHGLIQWPTHYHWKMGVSIVMGVSRSWNPMKMDDDWGYPYFRKPTNGYRWGFEVCEFTLDVPSISHNSPLMKYIIPLLAPKAKARFSMYSLHVFSTAAHLGQSNGRTWVQLRCQMSITMVTHRLGEKHQEKHVNATRKNKGKKAGRKEGSKEARKQGSKEARKQGRRASKAGKEGRKGGRKEGKKERKEGRNRGRKEGARRKGEGQEEGTRASDNCSEEETPPP